MDWSIRITSFPRSCNTCCELSVFDRGRVVREVYAKFELANIRFVRTAYNAAGPTTKRVKNTHLDKLSDTEVVDYPYEEHVTRAQMSHDSPFDEVDMPSVSVSIFFRSSCWKPKRVYVVYQQFKQYKQCTCHGIVLCVVYKAWSRMITLRIMHFLDFAFHINWASKNNLTIMRRHLGIISSSIALRDTLTLEEVLECSNIVSMFRAPDRCYQYTAQWARRATSVEVYNCFAQRNERSPTT
jgi:hypothetical protein